MMSLDLDVNLWAVNRLSASGLLERRITSRYIDRLDVDVVNTVIFPFIRHVPSSKVFNRNLNTNHHRHYMISINTMTAKEV